MRKIKLLLQNLTKQTKVSSKWVTVFSSHDTHAVSVHRLLLEDRNITYIIINQQDSTYNAFGLIYIQVLHTDLAFAQKVLNSQDE